MRMRVSCLVNGRSWCGCRQFVKCTDSGLTSRLESLSLSVLRCAPKWLSACDSPAPVSCHVTITLHGAVKRGFQSTLFLLSFHHLLSWLPLPTTSTHTMTHQTARMMQMISSRTWLSRRSRILG